MRTRFGGWRENVHPDLSGTKQESGRVSDSAMIRSRLVPIINLLCCVNGFTDRASSSLLKRVPVADGANCCNDVGRTDGTGCFLVAFAQLAHYLT